MTKAVVVIGIMRLFVTSILFSIIIGLAVTI